MLFRSPTSNSGASATKTSSNPFASSESKSESDPFSNSKDINIPDEDLPF